MTSPRISPSHLADIMGVSKSTVSAWEKNGRCTPHLDENGQKYYLPAELGDFAPVKEMIESDWETEMHAVPQRPYTGIELFAGAGGLALGFEQAGIQHVMLNEVDHDACSTLKLNRPSWRVIEEDVHNIDFTEWADKIDVISGGFPCQAFSYAGKKSGFDDTRGTLFFELARAVQTIRPKVFVGENVRGLFSHDEGRTLDTIRKAIDELGYVLIEPRVLQAMKYQVPQKRERLFLIAIRKDLFHKANFQWPSPYHRIMTLQDAFFKGELFATDVPESNGQQYPEKKKKVLQMVPMGGNWKDLPEAVQKEYMGGSFLLGGGKTGIARRLSLHEPSLTLTCSPAQKQTERCHPTEDRPLTTREYARIQTFPDDWRFCGSLSSVYKQIGNAVPVNLSYAVGRSIVRLLNSLEA